MIGKNKGKKIKRDFNLPRFFNVFSLGIILLVSIALSVIFTMHQKSWIIDHSIRMAESYAYHLNNEIAEHYSFPLSRHGNSRTIDKESIKLNELDEVVSKFIKNYKNIFKIKIYNRNGIVVYSTDPENIGAKTDSENFSRALSNKISSEMTKKMNPLEDKTEKGKIYELDILEVYVPIISEIDHDSNHDNSDENVEITGVLEIYQDITHMIHTVEKESYTISLYVFLSMGTLFFLLHAIIKKADRIISKKNEEIDRYNMTLEKSQLRIRESINEVIEHGSFHVRFQGSDLLKCWEVKKCNQTECPSHNDENLRCWQVAGTFCQGKAQGVFAQKFGDCRKCEVYKHAETNKVGMIGENFNNMMTLLENKHAELELANEKLNRLVDIDPLTQIGNRRSFHKRMENTHLLSIRHNHAYSILICDVDNFKIYNDTYGHQKGDYVLISITNKIKASLRKSDEVFRWGGEEFVVILPEQDIHSSLKVAENLRAGVQSLGIELAGSEWKVVTVSMGVACNDSDNDNVKTISWEKVLKKADDALYRAKSEGRNRVCSPIMVEKESPTGI